MEVRKFEIRCSTVEDTHALGKKMGQAAAPGTVMALAGPLGAGKTHFTQGVALGLGIPEDEYVVSPTFVVVMEHHSGRMPLYHVDLYRLEEAEEAGEIGLQDMMASEGVTVVEWADRFPELFPTDTIWIHITINPDMTRIFHIEVSEGNSNLLKILDNL